MTHTFISTPLKTIHDYQKTKIINLFIYLFILFLGVNLLG